MVHSDAIRNDILNLQRTFWKQERYTVQFVMKTTVSSVSPPLDTLVSYVLFVYM